MPSLNSTLLSSCCHRVPQEYTQLSDQSPKIVKSQDTLANDPKKEKNESKFAKWKFFRRWCSQSKNKEGESICEDRDLDKNIKLILDKAVRSLNPLEDSSQS